MGSNTVVSEKSVQHRAEYIVLRSACVHNDCAGGVFSEADMLRSTGEEAQYPVTQYRRQAQVIQLVYEFGGDDSVECQTVINEKQFGIAVFIFQVS